MYIQECMAFNGQEIEAFIKTKEVLREICSYYQEKGKGCENCMFSEGCSEIFCFLTNAIEDERVVLDIVAKRKGEQKNV